MRIQDILTNLVEVVNIVADVDAETRVCNSLLQIWELRFGHKAFTFVQTLSTRLVKILKLKFLSWSLASILPLMLCRGYYVESWSRF